MPVFSKLRGPFAARDLFESHIPDLLTQPNDEVFSALIPH
jgi:hypothetical protein